MMHLPYSGRSLKFHRSRNRALAFAIHKQPLPLPWLISSLMHKTPTYSHIIHLLKSSTCFEHYRTHLQEIHVAIVYMQPLVSSLSAGDCSVHRLRKKYIQLRRGPPEDERGNARNM